jgi:hypothetical protein
MTLILLLLACQSQPEPVDPDVVTSAARPDGRSEIAGVLDPASGAMVFFGGNEGPIVNQNSRASFRDDTWLFTPGTGWEEVVDDGPSARGRYATAYDPATRRAMFFGGRFRQSEDTGDYRLFKDLWAFDFTTRAWSEIDTGRGGPSPRYYPSAAWDAEENALYVFGGAVNTSSTIIEPSMDLWRWTESDGWSEIPTSGDAPSDRTFFGTAYDPESHRMWLFGGQVGDFVSQAFQDLYALDVRTGTWEKHHAGRDKAPSTRMHAGMLWDDARRRVVLFGGHTDIGDGNDLWTFDEATGAWSTILRGDRFTNNGLGCLDNPAEVPADYVEQDLSAPERRHRGMGVISGDNLFIFGGMHSECSQYLDDTWRFDLVGGAWHEIIEARTGESCARRGDACECLCL